MTQDLDHQIADMIRILALLQEARRLKGNRGYDHPIRQVNLTLTDLRQRVGKS